MKFFRTRPLRLIFCMLVGCLLILFFCLIGEPGSAKSDAREFVNSVFRAAGLLVNGRVTGASTKLPEIEFHGVVRDSETGKGIPDVSVVMRWDDGSLSGQATRELTTDQNGEFELMGVRGGNLFVQVREPPEYQGLFDGTRPFFLAARATNALPSKANPSVFEMRPVRINYAVRSAYGIADSPKKYMAPYHDFDSSGRPVHFQFTDRVLFGKAEHIRIGVKAEFTKEEWERGDEWVCEVSIPGAGLTEEMGLHDHVAPESGYEETRIFRFDEKIGVLRVFVRDTEGRFYMARLRLEPFKTESALAQLWISMDSGRNFETSKR